METSSNKRIFRAAVLGLFLVALQGPWFFDLINVPAQYPCSPPFIRLEGDYCGTPISGMWFIGALFFGLLGSAGSLLADWRPLLILLVLVLPLVSTAVLLVRENRPTWLGFQAVVSAVVVVFILVSGMIRIPQQVLVLWGASLYLAVSAATLVVDGLGLVAASKV